MGVSLYWTLSVLCVFVCVISNHSTSKKLHHVSDLSKRDALLHKTRSKVLLLRRYQGSTFVKCHIKCGANTDSAEVTRPQKEQWGWGLEATGKGKGVKQNLKEGVGNIGVIFIK